VIGLVASGRRCPTQCQRSCPSGRRRAFTLGQLKAPALSEEDAGQSVADFNDSTTGDVRYYKKTIPTTLMTYWSRLMTVVTHSDKVQQTPTRQRRTRVLNAKNNWGRLQHCGTFTGDGLWKVRCNAPLHNGAFRDRLVPFPNQPAVRPISLLQWAGPSQRWWQVSLHGTLCQNRVKFALGRDFHPRRIS